MMSINFKVHYQTITTIETNNKVRGLILLDLHSLLMIISILYVQDDLTCKKMYMAMDIPKTDYA